MHRATAGDINPARVEVRHSGRVSSYGDFNRSRKAHKASERASERAEQRAAIGQLEFSRQLLALSPHCSHPLSLSFSLSPSLLPRPVSFSLPFALRRVLLRRVGANAALSTTRRGTAVRVRPRLASVLACGRRRHRRRRRHHRTRTPRVVSTCECRVTVHALFKIKIAPRSISTTTRT